MRRFVLLTTVFIPFITLFSQGVIKGRVLYLNSGKKPAVGVEVLAAGSNGDYSKSDGAYTLHFPHKKVGETVYPKIGIDLVLNGRKTKKIELVNIEKLNGFNIPLNPNEAPLEIIVCPKGLRDRAALKYYNILKTKSDDLLIKKERELLDIKKKLKSSNNLLGKLEEDINRLREVNKDTLSFYKQALEIASINRDDASKRVIDYLDALDSGIDIELARKILNTKKAYVEAVLSKDKINASIEEIQRDGQSLINLFEYERAFQKYDTISLLLKKKFFNPKRLINHLEGLATFCKKNHYDEKAISYYEQIIEVIDEENLKKTLKVDYLNSLGDSYKLLNLYNKAEKCFFRSLEILGEMPKHNSFDENLSLMYTYLNIGNFYNYVYESKKANNFFKKAFACYEYIASKYPNHNIEETLSFRIRLLLSLEFEENTIISDLEPFCLKAIHDLNKLNLNEYDKKILEFLIKFRLVGAYYENKDEEKIRPLFFEVLNIYKKYLKNKALYKVDYSDLANNKRWVYQNIQKDKFYTIFNFFEKYIDKNKSTSIVELIGKDEVFSKNKKDTYEVQQKLKKSTETLEALVNNNPKRYIRDLAEIILYRSEVLDELKQHKKAISLAQMSIDKYKIIAKENPGFLVSKIASINNFMGLAYDKIDDKSAIEYYTKAVNQYQSVNKEGFYNLEINYLYEDVADLYWVLAENSVKSSQFKVAENYYFKVLEFYEKLNKRSLELDEYTPDIADVKESLGDLYSKTNQFEKSEKCYLETLKIYEYLIKKDLNISYHKYSIIKLQRNLGDLNKNNKFYEEAMRFYVSATKGSLQLLKSNLKKFDEIIENELTILVFSFREIGIFQKKQGNLLEAIKAYEYALSIAPNLLNKNSESNKKNFEAISNNLISVNIKIGEKFYKKKDFIASKKYFYNSLLIANKLHENSLIKYNNQLAYINIYLGLLYAKSDLINKEKSLYYTNKALEYYSLEKQEANLNNINLAKRILEHWKK